MRTIPRGEGGGYSPQSWVSTVKLIEKVIAVNPRGATQIITTVLCGSRTVKHTHNGA